MPPCLRFDPPTADRRCTCTGRWRPAWHGPPGSDVDLLTVGPAPAGAAEIARDLSVRFSELSRGVAIAAARHSDFSREDEEGYGGRVFLKHYCVHLTGPDLHSALPDFAADARAARGFNGDIARHVERWRRELHDDADPVQLGRCVARKTLFAVAGLVSVHDGTWTTDRATAAARRAEIEPSTADDLSMLLSWSHVEASPDRVAVGAALAGAVARITASFARSIGLWSSDEGP